jgi:hypothetical protein
MKSPCIDCATRHMGCQAECANEDYAKMEAEKKRIREAREAERQSKDVYYGYLKRSMHRKGYICKST